MLSLYFNCRLATQQLNHDKVDSCWLYPVTNPRRGGTPTLSPYEALRKSIASYITLSFDIVVFNLAFDSLDSMIEENLSKYINLNYSANKIIINFKRPATLDEWKIDVNDLFSVVEKNSPILVVMNHDHPFVDYTPIVFRNVVKKVFDRSKDNLGKVLYYSHAPEAVSLVINAKPNRKFVEESQGLFTRTVSNEWVDSLWVMTAETLIHILSKAKAETSAYMGRLDWPGVGYSNLKLKTYIFPREFFKHLDGYGHVTGLRVISDIRDALSFAPHFPSDNVNGKLVEFYYQRWVDCFLLSIRDSLRDEVFTIASRRASNICFRKAIESSLKLFRIGYLEADESAGLISEHQVDVLENALRSHIYYYGNRLFELIKTDIVLLDGDLYKVKNIIKKSLQIILPIANLFRAKFSRT